MTLRLFYDMYKVISAMFMPIPYRCLFASHTFSGRCSCGGLRTLLANGSASLCPPIWWMSVKLTQVEVVSDGVSNDQDKTDGVNDGCKWTS